MLRAILFDFNGILVDDEPLHFELFREVLAEEGIAFDRDEYWSTYLGLDDRGCFATKLVAEGREADPAYVSRLIARKSAYYQARIERDGYPFFPGGLDLVREAVARGLRLGVVSGALRGEIEGALAQAGLAERLRVIVAAEDVSESKPHPEGYRRGLERLNSEPPLPERLLHPHEVLAIEDSPAGLEAARGAGLLTLGVGHTYPPAALEGADATVPSLAATSLGAIVGTLGLALPDR